MFFLWRKAAVPAFIVTVMATASRMDPESCRPRARQAIVLVHMAADVCQWDITLPRLPGMDRPPDRRPEVLHLRRQGDTRLPPDPKRVHLRHLQPSEWKLTTCHNYFVSSYQERARASGDDVTVLTLDGSGHFDMLYPAPGTMKNFRRVSRRCSDERMGEGGGPLTGVRKTLQQ